MKPMRRNWFWILLVLTIVLLLFGIGWMIFSVNSRLTGTEYQFQVDAVLAAAKIENGGEPLTDPGKAVVAEYEGRRAVVVPANYAALSSYLRKDAASPLFLSIQPEKSLKLTVCGEAEIYAMPEEGNGDVVLIQMTTQGRTFRIRTDGGNQWSSLLRCCMEGTYHDANIPLD